jgi:branched-chain amino acid transport system permease protein
VQIGATRAASVAIALGVLIVLAIVLRATRVGLVLRAALSNPAMVGALGVPLPRVHALVFGASCALAGLAGVLGGNLFVIEPAMAASVTGLAFVIIVIGGLGSLSGALIASLAVAAVQVFSAASTASVAGIDIARLAGALPYLLMVLVLALRPRGLAGDRE